MLKSVLLFPIRAAGMAAFFYAFGGWMLIPPSAILGAF